MKIEKLMKNISRILNIALRELRILKGNPIYAFCMVAFINNAGLSLLCMH